MMRLSKGGTLYRQARNAGRSRQLRKLALAAVFLLAACGQSETDRESDRAANAANPAGLSPTKANLSATYRSSSFAAVSADESRAAEVGRDILQGGGNATDAATAMFFALSVTLPSAASLGASGACIVHDEKTKAAEAIVFPPIAAGGAIAGQTFAVPVGVRGVTLMHVRHGQLRWEQVVAPAEKLARFGVPVSRALSRDLRDGASMLGADRETRRIFGKGGGMVSEGDVLVQSDLAGTLGAIRQRGGGAFFQGPLARTLSEQIAQMGGSLPVDALRGAVPQAGPPVSDAYGTFARRRVYAAPPPAAGASALAGWRGQAPGGATPANSAGFSGLIAVDSKGGAAACTLSMGQLFGARAIVTGTGLLLAAATPDAGSVSPLIIASPANGEFAFAGAGGGAPTAAQATGVVAYDVIERSQNVNAALGARGGQGGWVNAIACPSGLRGGAASCQIGLDPASSGLALLATNR
jgi:gamma-glutamyltranspeptidase/glutathione hydrolase